MLRYGELLEMTKYEEELELKLADAGQLISKLESDNARLRDALSNLITVYRGQIQNDGEYTIIDELLKLTQK